MDELVLSFVLFGYFVVVVVVVWIDLVMTMIYDNVFYFENQETREVGSFYFLFHDNNNNDTIGS